MWQILQVLEKVLDKIRVISTGVPFQLNIQNDEHKPKD
jgi:hypothetical protein